MLRLNMLSYLIALFYSIILSPFGITLANLCVQKGRAPVMRRIESVWLNILKGRRPLSSTSKTTILEAT
jgi:hypothetical protein